MHLLTPSPTCLSQNCEARAASACSPNIHCILAVPRAVESLVLILLVRCTELCKQCLGDVGKEEAIPSDLELKGDGLKGGFVEEVALELSPDKGQDLTLHIWEEASH